MKFVRFALVALLGALTLAACTDSADDLEGAVTSLVESEDLAATAEELRSEVEQLGTEIENSEAAAELQEGWDDLRADLSSAIDSMANNETIDTEAIEESFESFEADLEAAGDSVSDELENAWNELRETIERLTG